MASKSLITLGAGLVLAMTLGCSSNKEEQSSCSADTQSDKNNCGQCGNVCSGDQTCQAGVCKDSTSDGTGGSSSKKTTTTGKGGSSNSTTSKAANKGGSGGEDTSAAEGGSSGDGEGGTKAATKGGSSSKASTTKAAGGSTSKSSTTTKAAGGSSNVGGTSAKAAGGVGGTSASSSSVSAKGGATATGDGPAGWWTSWKDEGWHGCAWTGVDSLKLSPPTSISPKDFTTKAAADPYHVSGSVSPDPPRSADDYGGYGGVALLGFNLNQDPSGASCAYDPEAGSQDGPPGVTFESGPTGIAVNFAKNGTDTSFTLRIQIQGPKGATDETQRWCQTITAANGKAFLPFNKFYTACWFDGVTGKDPGTQYKGEPVSAIVFTVPGLDTKAVPYDFTVNGFALGSSATDAPDGGVVGTNAGKIGGSDSGDNSADYKRVRVSADGHDYVIQNNNWGSPNSTNQELTYKDNSFSISGETGNSPDGSKPASFPSIYIGASGNTANGQYSTHPGDGLPKLVSEIKSVQTTFKYNRCSGSGYNASYDVWFADKSNPTNYDDGISGFVMVWLCKPSDKSPIGPSGQTKQVTIDGKSWTMWEGPRNGPTNANAPVVSYVANSTLLSYTFDLNLFIQDAVKQGYIKSSWYLTDVFGGFEIWSGGGTKGLSLDAFTCVVQ